MSDGFNASPDPRLPIVPDITEAGTAIPDTFNLTPVLRGIPDPGVRVLVQPVAVDASISLVWDQDNPSRGPPPLVTNEVSRFTWHVRAGDVAHAVFATRSPNLRISVTKPGGASDFRRAVYGYNGGPVDYAICRLDAEVLAEHDANIGAATIVNLDIPAYFGKAIFLFRSGAATWTVRLQARTFDGAFTNLMLWTQAAAVGGVIPDREIALPSRINRLQIENVGAAGSFTTSIIRAPI